MSPIRRFFLPVCFSGLLSATVSAAWNDHRQANPILEFFPNRLTGATPQTGPVVQDARGRLFVGSDTLLVYDGVTWTSHPLPDSYNLAALSFGSGGRLWAGAHNQVGYYAENAAGAFVFTSLMAKLPAKDRQLEFTWGCGEVGAQVYFVCQSKVLRWDGEKMTVWNFPTETRLYPVRLGAELWFTHLETGLYRLTANGPQLEYGPQELPADNPAFGLERDAGGLRHFSRNGVCYVGKPQQPLCSATVIEFLRSRPLSSIQRLPDGNYAIGTLGGLGIMSANGELLRTFSQENGLGSNAITGLFLDQEKQLWISQTTSGIARLDPTGSISLFQRWGQADRASIFRLVQTHDDLFAAADAGLFRLEKEAGGQSRFLLLEAMPTHVADVAVHREGLLLGRFGGLDFFDGQQVRPLFETPSLLFWRILPSHQQRDVFFGFSGQKIMKATVGSDGRWLREDLGELPDYGGDCYLDPLDNLWLNSAKLGLWYFETSTRKFTQVHNGEKSGSSSEMSQLTGYGGNLYFFAAQEGYVVPAGSQSLRRIPGFPAVTVVQCITSPDGRRLYVVFERKLSGRTAFGLGRLLLDGQGNASNWTELQAPKLETAGAPASLLVTSEDDTDALWVGGSDGVVRIKPAELAPVHPPIRPWLTATELSGQAPAAGPIPAYAFSGHHLLIQAGTAEIDDRPRLMFQTRLVNSRGDWSQPSARSTFEFTNLTDGNYTFEVRAINEAGMVSESVAHSFLILPPWYRTPLAYFGFAAAAAAAVLGYIRFHERRMRARNLQLESLVEKRTVELVKANSAKDEFLAGISHEIRNPMNGVIGIATVIDDTRFDPTTRQHMAQLRHCATHLSSLLEDILDYSRLQAGAVDLNPRPFDLLELTEALAALTSAESAQRGIPVEIAVSPTVPGYLIGDVARLRQILLNYIVNALKYSGRGTVCLTVWGQQSLPDQVALTFAVSDDGPGISPEEQARLFTRFERGAAAQAQRVAGTGLGLALCKTLGEKMGGRLWVESEPGQGSTFYLAVSLPVAAGAPARLKHDKIKPDAIGVLRALVVDDEEYNRITLSSFLFDLGFQVETASTGDAALAIARQQTLHAIFLDLNLPGMNGLEIARALRAMANLEAGLPIIATTAYATADKRNQCIEAGMSAFLTKPISLEKIHAALTSATSTQRAAPSYHPPVQNPNADPLGSLRLLAHRKDVPVETEVARYFAELESEYRLLAEALKRRDSSTAGDAAHRLVGRFAFVQATVEVQLARDIEANSMNEFWDPAEASASRLNSLLPGLRDRISAAV